MRGVCLLERDDLVQDLEAAVEEGTEQVGQHLLLALDGFRGISIVTATTFLAQFDQVR